MARILLVEDEPDMARYLIQSLTNLQHEVVHCDGVSKSLQLAESKEWNLIIVDRMFSDERDGLEIIKSIRVFDNKIPILIISALASVGDRILGLHEGGDDYLTKPFVLDEFLARVAALIRRNAPNHHTQPYPASELIVIADLTINLQTRKVERANHQISLQPREFHLLEYLARNQGQIVTRKMLLETIWGLHIDPHTNVIEAMMSRLRTKIDKGFQHPLLHSVRGVGYRLSAS